MESDKKSTIFVRSKRKNPARMSKLEIKDRGAVDQTVVIYYTRESEGFRLKLMKHYHLEFKYMM